MSGALIIRRGVTFTRKIRFKHEPGAGVDPIDAEPFVLTGNAVRAVARECESGPVRLDLDPEISDGSEGEITVSLNTDAPPFEGYVDFHQDFTATPGESVGYLGRARIILYDQTTQTDS